MDEVWKDVVGYEGLYQVSNLGRVRSSAREKKARGGSVFINPGRILTGSITNYGYRQVTLCKDNKSSKKQLHRLVAEAFLPNTDDKLLVVDHINGDKLDNRAENLRWVTYTENNNNWWTHRRISELETENQELRNYIAYLESRA